MRTVLLAAVAALSSCAGGPIADAQLDLMNDQQLIEQATSAAAMQPGYLRYDSAYRPRVVALLAKKRNWSEADTSKVLAGNIWQGADTWQVTAAWGGTRHKSSHTLEGGTVVETWTYRRGLGSAQLVSFRNGVCTGWSSYK